jgi:hypothetical protein
MLAQFEHPSKNIMDRTILARRHSHGRVAGAEVLTELRAVVGQLSQFDVRLQVGSPLEQFPQPLPLIVGWLVDGVGGETGTPSLPRIDSAYGSTPITPIRGGSPLLE